MFSCTHVIKLTVICRVFFVLTKHEFIQSFVETKANTDVYYGVFL